MSHLQNKNLLNEEIGAVASQIAKKLYIRKMVHKFQIKCAYSPPNKFDGSCLDGRDITTKIMPNAIFKFFITAHVNVRAKRRFIELKKNEKKYFVS